MKLDSPNGEFFGLHGRYKLLVALVVIESQGSEKLAQILVLSETLLGNSEHVVEVHNFVLLEVKLHPV